MTAPAAERAIDPTSFCSIAARMLAAGGRANIPAVLVLLSQALRADVELQEPDTTDPGELGRFDRGPGEPGPSTDAPNVARTAIPQPRIRSTVDLSVGALAGAVAGVPVDLPVRSRGVVVAVLSIEPSLSGIPEGWAGSPGPLGTVADLLALALAAEPGSTPTAPAPAPASADASAAAREASLAWFDYDERDRADLAGHLHDGLVQSLIAARYLLDLAARAQPDGALPWLDSLRESLQEALADGRGLLTSLQPRTRHERGLRLALEEFCAGSRLPVTLVAAPDPDRLPLLSPVVAAAAYRFVQAAVADLAARGIPAGEVRLAYAHAGDACDLTVEVVPVSGPDGEPVAAASPEPGEPLERWARRIQLLGGHIALDGGVAHLCFSTADGERGSASSTCLPAASADPAAADPVAADPARADSASPIPTRLSAGRTK